MGFRWGIWAAAAELGVSWDMVSKWRGRFLRDRLEGLNDEPWPGRHRAITDERVELVVTKTLEEPGPGRTRTQHKPAIR